MSSNKEIMEWMQIALADSVEISTFCNTNFGTLHTVFVGIDEDDLPGKEVDRKDNVIKNDYPFIAIVPMESKEGNMPTRDYSFIVEVAIENDTKTTSGNKVTYNGLYLSEDLAVLVKDVLDDAFASDTNAQDRNYMYQQSDIGEHPYYSGMTKIEFDLPRYVGGDATFLR